MPPAPCDVKRAEAWHDVVAPFRPWRARISRKLADRAEQCISIDSGLPSAKILGCPANYVCKIELGEGAEANTPALLDHPDVIRGRVK